MRKSLIPILALSLTLLAQGPALARAPTLEELPTVQKVFEDAEKAREDNARAEAERNRDPKMDLIRDYEEGKASLYRWNLVADLIKKDKEQKYRDAAAWAIRVRFRDLPTRDITVIKIKREIGHSLLSTLNSREKSDRVAVAGIFRDFWPGDYARIGYDPNEVSFRERSKKLKQWEKVVRK